MSRFSLNFFVSKITFSSLHGNSIHFSFAFRLFSLSCFIQFSFTISHNCRRRLCEWNFNEFFMLKKNTKRKLLTFHTFRSWENLWTVSMNCPCYPWWIHVKIYQRVFPTQKLSLSLRHNRHTATDYLKIFILFFRHFHFFL